MSFMLSVANKFYLLSVVILNAVMLYAFMLAPHTHTHTHAQTHMHTYAPPHTHMYTHMHTHTHTHNDIKHNDIRLNKK
jgi:hypothetical protein